MKIKDVVSIVEAEKIVYSVENVVNFAFQECSQTR